MTAPLATSAAIEGLQPTARHPLPFAPSLAVRAFVLRREQGNVLIYSTPGLAAERDALGPVARRYLNHHHEAMFPVDWPEAPLFVHAAERATVERAMHVRGSFSKRHRVDDDLEVIPTPGHTPGATAFLWETASHRLLFTGDTIYLRDDEWVAAVLASSDLPAYLESLELLRELDFDVLVPWAASADGPWLAHTDRADARRRIDAIIARLRAGEDR